jgi:hypothetical protein
MSTLIPGVVANGVIVPILPIPDGTKVEIRLQEDAMTAKPCSASELRRMPREQRQAALAAAAEMAVQDYLHDKDLTGFDAFSEELDDDSA